MIFLPYFIFAEKFKKLDENQGLSSRRTYSIQQDKNGFDYVKTIILNDDALLVGNVNNYKWELNLDDESDRKLFRNTIFLKFMIAVYENSEEKPYPLQGDLLYRVPLINRIFARPYDREKRGKGNTLNLYMRMYEKL